MSSYSPPPALILADRLKEAVEDHMPNAHMTEKSQAFADTLVSYAKICMEDEFKVSPIELSARQEKIKGFIGVSG